MYVRSLVVVVVDGGAGPQRGGHGGRGGRVVVGGAAGGPAARAGTSAAGAGHVAVTGAGRALQGVEHDWLQRILGSSLTLRPLKCDKDSPTPILSLHRYFGYVGHKSHVFVDFLLGFPSYSYSPFR